MNGADGHIFENAELSSLSSFGVTLTHDYYEKVKVRYHRAYPASDKSEPLRNLCVTEYSSEVACQLYRCDPPDSLTFPDAKR